MPAETTTSVTDLPADNPFARPSALPYGLPDFAAIRTQHLRPALDAGLAAQRQEWEAIAADPAAPDVANTLEALERSGQLLHRVATVFFTLVSAVGDEEVHAIDAEYAPRLAAHRDALWLDGRVFARLEHLHGSREELGLDAETDWLLTTYRKNFLRAGIRLDEEQQQRLRDVNAELVSLETTFSQRVVTALEHGAVHVPDAGALAGLDEGTLAGLARAAEERGAGTGYLLTLQLPTQQALLTQLQDRGMRDRLLQASQDRGTGVDADSDTRAALLRIARLRAERARLLGYEHHAAWVAEDGTAATTDAVNAMLRRLARPAARNAEAEAQDLQHLLDEDPQVPAGPTLAAADWAYYAERLRKERFAFDDSVLRPYLELDRVLHDGVFFAAGQLYGLTFHERTELRGYAEDVRVWEVREADGTGLGLFVGDYYARAGKRGGAWMNNLVDQSGLLGLAPVVLNNLNITPPPAGEPTLLTWDEVRTCFHEFGHALHGLFSDVRYPSLSGTAVPRDFVEFPSQVNEMWMTHPVVLERFARHHRTGEPLDEELRAAVLSLGSYGEGFATSEYLGAALLDQAWHQLSPEEVPEKPADVRGFEVDALERVGLARATVPPRYRSTYFNHTFGGGYDAGYYSYIWSEVLDADTVEWFRDDGARNGDGGLNREAGDRFRTALLSRGNSQDPLRSFRELRGRDAALKPLLQRRGLTD
ncbi:M3 family metallopeptidase [Georgenia sp. 10Sc9-8]|uniref:M3 family metallopeptidase n=1 Tax=Georgenia halotolerans TaxID=3028317 RepID=A0ABT5U1I6_9MICO|nr:M3 family metallopeptidase [Georgenia halotolerans]